MTDAMKHVGAGRPKINNQEALQGILNNPDKREEFIICIERLVRSKEGVNLKADLYSDDCKSTAETYSLGKGFVSNIITTIVKGDLDSALGELANKTDILELFTDRLAIE